MKVMVLCPSGHVISPADVFGEYLEEDDIVRVFDLCGRGAER
jgi:hypothetical protein